MRSRAKCASDVFVHRVCIRGSVITDVGEDARDGRRVQAIRWGLHANLYPSVCSILTFECSRQQEGEGVCEGAWDRVRSNVFMSAPMNARARYTSVSESVCFVILPSAFRHDFEKSCAPTHEKSWWGHANQRTGVQGARM